MTAPAPLVVALPSGGGAVTLSLHPARGGSVEVLETAPAPALADPAGAVEEALARPLGARPLAEIARSKRSACVVVSDKTRPVPNRVLLPPLLRTLEEAGLSPGEITLLIATGMHEPTEGAALTALLGEEILSRYPVVNHDCADREWLRRVLEIESAPVEVNRRYLDAEVKILTGLIEPHGLAGYSGGGKSILPGIASLETLRFMHSFQMVETPGVTVGSVAGNPFRRHIAAVSAAAGVDFLLNVVIDRERRITSVHGGALAEAFDTGCAAADRAMVRHLAAPADLVITTGGGAPSDDTFYQASKGLYAAKELVREGGTVLFVASCPDGLGSESYRRLVTAYDSYRAFADNHRDPGGFALDQWAAQAFYQVRERAGRILFASPGGSGISGEDLAAMGVEGVDDLEKTVAALCAAHPTVYVIPEGPYLAGVVDREERKDR